MRRGDGDWVPLLEIGANRWFGRYRGRWWTGSDAEPKREVDLSLPFTLFPLLEFPVAEVSARLKSVEVPEELETARIAESAMRSGMNYWATCALEWLDQLPEIADRDALLQLSKAAWARQATRHRAIRLLRRLREPERDNTARADA